jgi:hypothetical protein
LQNGKFPLSYILGDVWHRDKVHDCNDWYRKIALWLFNTASEKHHDYSRLFISWTYGRNCLSDCKFAYSEEHHDAPRKHLGQSKNFS